MADLEEYGFDLKKMTTRIDNYEEFREKVTHISSKVFDFLSDKVQRDYAKARCHPMVEKYVHPHVKYFWDFYPFILIAKQFALLFDCILCPCFWWCWFPITIFCSIPWNVFCFTFCFFPCWGVHFCTLPCSFCCAATI